jgi:hypothetical protein
MILASSSRDFPVFNEFFHDDGWSAVHSLPSCSDSTERDYDEVVLVTRSTSAGALPSKIRYHHTTFQVSLYGVRFNERRTTCQASELPVRYLNLKLLE